MIRVVGPNPAMDRTQLFSNVQLNEVNRSTFTKVVAGGKGLNVARTVNTLGKPVTAYGFVGGVVGEYLRSECRRLGIVDRHTEILADTRVCNILVEESTGWVTVLNEKGPNVSASEADALVETLTSDCEPGDLVILSGSLPGNISPSYYAELIEKLQDKEVRILVDASGEPLKQAIQAKPWMVKTNIHEFKEIFGIEIFDDHTIVQAMRRLVDTGISVVVVTFGERGVFTVTQEDTFWVQVPKIKAVNPIASGDTFLGGFAVKYLEMQNIEQAVQFGTTCAVANVMNLTPELPQDVDLQELLKSVRVVRDEIYRY